MDARIALLCLLLALSGCASKPAPVVRPPAILSPAAWQQVDQALVDASLGATGSASDYARRSMRVWKDGDSEAALTLMHRHLDQLEAKLELDR